MGQVIGAREHHRIWSWSDRAEPFCPFDFESSMNSDVAPILRENASDKAVAGSQVVASIVDAVVPGAGGFFSLIAGQIIPNQRAERLAEFATRLGRRLRVAEGAVESLTERFEALANSLSSEQIALFEDGAIAAAKATSQERIEGVAKIVAEGLSASDLEASNQRRLLNLINDLSDEDIVVLTSYSFTYGRNQEWRAAHSQALEPTRAHMGSSQEELDRNTMRELRTSRLLSLGVLVEKANAGGRSTYKDLTPLGRYVLKQLGVLGDDEM